MKMKEKHDPKGENRPQNSSKGNSSNNKFKEKEVYKGKNRLTPEELERYRKDNRCFKCGGQGHSYCTFSQQNAHNEQPRASIIEASKGDVHCKDVFNDDDDIPGELPLKRGDDDHPIALLPDNKLSINQKKSEFLLQEIQYLGHIISQSGIHMNPTKFYDKQEAFDKIKQNLTSQPMLALPDLSKPFEVQCDACGDCLGVVLLQEAHAIAYESRRLSSAEQVLGIHEKGLLAVLHALDSWKHYLLGTLFILQMDHQSLKYFMTQTKLSDKQMRWANFLSHFNFQIAHIAGKHIQVANALSRRSKVNAVSIVTHNDPSSMTNEYAIDPYFKDVISTVALGKKEGPFTLQDGYLLHGNRLCITHSLCEKVMYESHAPPYAEHRGIQTTLKAIETYFYWLNMKRDIPNYVSKFVVCQKTKFDRGKQPGLLQPLPIGNSFHITNFQVSWLANIHCVG
ncbi:hypothetical protein L7F22_057227 [Adiantum nelumboides]|nr:hypothetical protein [Adiantum nelumboides]